MATRIEAEVKILLFNIPNSAGPTSAATISLR
jgi:hypothetical protein